MQFSLHACITQTLYNQIITFSTTLQDITLTGTDSSVDIATKENLKKFSQIGENLLKKPGSI